VVRDRRYPELISETGMLAGSYSVTVTLRLRSCGLTMADVIFHDGNDQVAETSGQEGEVFARMHHWSTPLYNLFLSLHLIFPTAAECAGKNIRPTTSSQ
jgi:hypothetical protein